MKFVLITLAQLLVSLIIVFPLIYYDVPRRTILFHNTNDNFPPIMILILHLITYYLVPLFEHILTLKGGGMVGGKVFSQDLVKDRIKYLRWEMLEGFVAIAIAIAFSSINHANRTETDAIMTKINEIRVILDSISSILSSSLSSAKGSPPVNFSNAVESSLDSLKQSNAIAPPSIGNIPINTPFQNPTFPSRQAPSAPLTFPSMMAPSNIPTLPTATTINSPLRFPLGASPSPPNALSFQSAFANFPSSISESENQRPADRLGMEAMSFLNKMKNRSGQDTQTRNQTGGFKLPNPNSPADRQKMLESIGGNVSSRDIPRTLPAAKTGFPPPIHFPPPPAYSSGYGASSQANKPKRGEPGWLPPGAVDPLRLPENYYGGPRYIPRATTMYPPYTPLYRN